MDPDEIMRLMRLIRENGHEGTFLQRTRRELASLGISVEAMSLPPETAPAGSVLACTVILPGEVLTLADNKTGPCAWRCGRTVQFRPWVPLTLETVCLYCLSERSKEDN